jgi:general stress protein YciG
MDGGIVELPQTKEVMMAEKSTSGRGFRGMSPEKRREIAAKGGRASRGSRKSNKRGTASAM